MSRKTFVFVAFQNRWKQVRILRVESGGHGTSGAVNIFSRYWFPRSTPLSSQVILDSIRYSDENTDSLFNISLLRRRQWYALLVRAAEQRSGQVTNRGQEDREIVAAIPESIIRGLVSKDKHKTYNYRKRWDLPPKKLASRSLGGFSLQHTICDGRARLCPPYVCKQTTTTVNIAWSRTGRTIAPWIAPLTKRKRRGQLASQHQWKAPFADHQTHRRGFLRIE